jgi:hypothetical protein
MWFFVGAVIVIVLFALWFRRTNMYRARRGGRSVKPGQGGFDTSGWRYGKYGD